MLLFHLFITKFIVLDQNFFTDCIKLYGSKESKRNFKFGYKLNEKHAFLSKKML